MVSKTKIIARYAETDQMGIIHHSVYPVWYEAARTDFIKQAGMTYSEMEQAGVMLPLLELGCTYKSSAYYEDELTICTRVTKLTPTRIEFGYEVYRNGEEKPINFGFTKHAWTTTSLKPINMKKHFPEILAIAQKAAEQE